MAVTVKPHEFEPLRKLIAELSGNSLADGKSYLIESRLGDLLPEYKLKSYQELYEKARRPTEKVLRNEIIDRMTINETLWFRDGHPFETLLNHHFPEFIKEQKTGSKRLRIWCAACSTGQEPYSIAMNVLIYAARNKLFRPGNVEIIATDICDTALGIAQKGYYDRIGMNRGLSIDLRRKFFHEEGRGWQINDEVKKLVRFRKFNLMDSFSLLGRFDIIMCRYVAIYFSKELKTEIYTKMTKTLNPKGALFLGSSESLTAYSDKFAAQRHQRSVYYNLK